MVRRGAKSSKAKSKTAPAGVKSTVKNASKTTARAKGKRTGKAGRKTEVSVTQDVFSDDEEEAARQEASMDARADVDGVYEYEQPVDFEGQDSEVDEDEAFNSEDEQAYGMFFGGASAKRKADRIEAQAEEDEDGDEEEAGGDLLSDLLGTAPAKRLTTADDGDDDDDDDDDDDVDESSKLANLSAMVDGLVAPAKTAKLGEIDAQFASGGALTSTGELTLGSLLGSSAAVADEEDSEMDTSGLDMRRVRQQVRELEGDGTTLTLQATREAVHDARASRKLAYTEKLKDVDVFEPVVRRNRQKATLDLRQQAAKMESLTPAALASKFAPQTDMEKSVAALLQAGDLSDKKLAASEQEELAQKRVSTAEVAARQKELAKLRALLFYEEQKQKRVKKIKSKLYHKIRNAQDKKAAARQKEQLRALDPELARQLDDELAEKRAEERLTLKHRNTSKWVKHQLRRGIQADDATRGAIADQLRRGEELRRKMDAVDSDDELDGDDDDEDEGGDAASRLQKRLEKQASALVTEIDADAVEAGKKRGLQGMKFMQRAAEKQREKARSEAERLLREIKGGDADGVLSEGEDYLSSGDERAGKMKSKKKSVVATAEDEAAVAKKLAGGALQTSSVSMDSGLSARASGAITVDLGDGSKDRSMALAQGESATATGGLLELGAKKTTQKAAKEVAGETEEQADQSEENPWLSSAATKSGGRNGKKNQKKARAQQKKKAAAQPGGGVDVAAAIESLAESSKGDASVTAESEAVTTLTTANSKAKSGKKRKLEQTNGATDKTTAETVNSNQKKSKKSKAKGSQAQDALVKRAFEFVADDGEDELAQEKDRLAGQDSEAKKGAEVAKLVGMAGWGSWAGDGVRVSKRQLAREQQAKELATKAKQQALANRKDARMDKVLINEKRDKRAAQFSVQDVPYPFTSRQEYEAAMRNPLGGDWNTAAATDVLTAPKIMKRAGSAIGPLVLSKEDRKQAKKELGKKRKAKF